MVNDLLNAITKQLGTTFGNTYRYYIEDVEQGLTKPCFTVSTISPRLRSTSAIAYDRTIPVVVHYFHNDKVNNTAGCMATAESTIESLEYLPFKETILRGEDISWQMVDDVLQIFITYRFKTLTVVDITNMENLEETNINE